MISSGAQSTTAKIVVVFSMLFIVTGVVMLGFGEWTGAFSIYDDWGGLTTLSISKAEFTSNKMPFYQGDVWVLHVTPYGMAQNFEGRTVSETITPSEMTDAGASKEPTDNLKIDLVSSLQECQYPILKDAEQPVGYENIRTDNHIYTITSKRWAVEQGCDESEIISHCGANAYAGGAIKTSGWFTKDDCWCVVFNKVTTAVDTNIPITPKMHTVTQFAVTVDGVTEFATFDSLREFGIPESGPLPERGEGDAVAYVVWQGYTPKSSCVYADSEDSDSLIHDISNYVAVQRYEDNQWHLIDKSNYLNYKTEKSSTMMNVLDESGRALEEWEYDALEDNIYDYARMTTLSLSQKDNVFDGITKVFGQTHDAVITQNLKENVALPNYVLYVKADYLKVHQPTDVKPRIETGYPKFVGHQTDTDVGKVYVKAKNIGTERGELTFSVDCEYPFYSVTYPQYKVVAPGDTSIVSFSISNKGSVIERVEDYCTVRVANKFGFEVNKKILVAVDPNQICTPNKKECGWGANLNEIVTCNTQGTGYLSETTDCAPMICKYKDEGQTPYCTVKDDDDEDDKEMCNTAEDCDDDNWLTVDKCDKSFVGDIFGGKGVCTHLDLTPIIIVVGLVFGTVALVLFALLAFAIVSWVKSKKK